jgi:hypothetical protein
LSNDATPEAARSVVAELRVVERLALSVLVAANVVFPLFLIVAAWPRPWRPFDGEDGPINWFSSVQCALLAGIALAVFLATRLSRAAGTEPAARGWPWLAFCLGFLAMSADEMFGGHEWIRESQLKPRGIFTDVELLLPGDVVLIAYALVGAVLAYFLLAELRPVRTAPLLFLTGLGLILVSAVQDSLDLRLFDDRDVGHVRTILEETAEIWAQLLFGLSFVRVLLWKLRGVLTGRTAPQR